MSRPPAAHCPPPGPPARLAGQPPGRPAGRPPAAEELSGDWALAVLPASRPGGGPTYPLPPRARANVFFVYSDAVAYDPKTGEALLGPSEDDLLAAGADAPRNGDVLIRFESPDRAERTAHVYLGGHTARIDSGAFARPGVLRVTIPAGVWKYVEDPASFYGDAGHAIEVLRIEARRIEAA